MGKASEEGQSSSGAVEPMMLLLMMMMTVQPLASCYTDYAIQAIQ